MPIYGWGTLGALLEGISGVTSPQRNPVHVLSCFVTVRRVVIFEWFLAWTKTLMQMHHRLYMNNSSKLSEWAFGFAAYVAMTQWCFYFVCPTFTFLVFILTGRKAVFICFSETMQAEKESTCHLNSCSLFKAENSWVLVLCGGKQTMFNNQIEVNKKCRKYFVALAKFPL